MSRRIPQQDGQYQPRKGYGLRWRDVRDHDGEFWAAFVSAFGLGVAGYLARDSDQMAMAFGLTAIWWLLGLTAWQVWQFVKGR